MPSFDFDSPHRRFDPLRGEWILVSPHRSKRPWQGQQEEPAPLVPAYDPRCYLCPGNTRTSGDVNPNYGGTYWFPNDFSALLPNQQHATVDEGLFSAERISGESRVLCYSPRHDLAMSTMEVEDIEQVITLWQETAAELGATYKWVQLFENRGSTMGMSSPHPHGQVWALDEIPTLVQREDDQQAKYFAKHGSPLLLDYVEQEIEREERVVMANERWAWIVPFWAVWPFEILLLPRRPVARLSDLDREDARLLADILKDGLGRYDRLFDTPFPYSMGWHFAPFDERPTTPWQLHAHFYPPLLRSASVRKFMVGFEMLAESQRDITPEQAAERLKSV